MRYERRRKSRLRRPGQAIEDRAAEPNAFGIWSVILTEQELMGAKELNFNRKYESGWENRDHRIALERSEASAVKLPLPEPETDELIAIA